MYFAVAMALVVTMALALARAVIGPTVYDRVLSVNMFGTKTVLLLSVIAFLYGRPDFLDLALAYALINFIGVLAVLAALLLAAGQLGWLSGRTPADLGVRDGRLKPPSSHPNSVSSQADLHKGTDARVDYARIAPLAGGGDLSATMTRLRAVIEAMPGARIVESRPDYLYVQFETRWLRFVDDADFLLDPAGHVIHVRSKSRLGSNDHGVNRKRIEALRRKLDLG